MNSTGNVGIGSVTDPQSLLELQDQKWMIFNAHANSSGILFHETGGKTASTIQYGGKIEYKEIEDALILGSYDNWVAKNALWINRQTGCIGIGENLWGTTYKLKVYGRALTTYSIWETSDIRFKENIEDLKDEPSLLTKLRGVSYKKNALALQNEVNTTNTSVSPTIAPPATNNVLSQKTDSVVLKTPIVPEREYGFIAQEVQAVLPNLVIQDEQGYLAINYTGLIPLLVESYKDLLARVEYLEDEITILKTNCCGEATNSDLKSAVISTGTNDNGLSAVNILKQNIPNPFTESTQIKYYLTANVTTAGIYIYNMNGTQLQRIELFQKGEGSVTINGGELKAGMYMYTLIADGKEVDTKKMILTD